MREAERLLADRLPGIALGLASVPSRARLQGHEITHTWRFIYAIGFVEALVSAEEMIAFHLDRDEPATVISCQVLTPSSVPSARARAPRSESRLTRAATACSRLWDRSRLTVDCRRRREARPANRKLRLPAK